MVEVGRGGTEQARFEREVIYDTIAARLVQLHLGDATLIFGRIDTEPEVAAHPVYRANGINGSNGHVPVDDRPRGAPADSGGDAFYIGRVAVADPNQEVVVVDWRAPVAEPFYRATGRSPKSSSSMSSRVGPRVAKWRRRARPIGERPVAR